MPPRLPTTSDFPSAITLTITSPPQSHPPTNVLILLHGLGDTHVSFANLARQLSLPETACITLQAPTPLPFGLPGFHWGDDLVFDPASADSAAVEQDTGFEKTAGILWDKIISEGLIGKCGYRPRDVMLFGFGQGGLLALGIAAGLGGGSDFSGNPSSTNNNSSNISSSTSASTASTASNKGKPSTRTVDRSLGGIIAIGGFLPSSATLPPTNKPKYATPVLLCKGDRGSAVTPAELKRVKDAFAAVEVCEWPKKGDGMPASRDESLPLMRFFARRLRSVRGIPAGAVEIS